MRRFIVFALIAVCLWYLLFSSEHFLSTSTTHEKEFVEESLETKTAIPVSRPPESSRHPTATVESRRKPLSLKEMTESIRNNQICFNDTQYMIERADYDRKELPFLLLSALLEANEIHEKNPDCISSLLTRSRKEALNLTRGTSNDICLFAHALFLSDQFAALEGQETELLNKTKALELLTALQQRSADNGIYTFFMLHLYEDDIEKATEEFNNFLKYEKIENPLSLIPLKVHRLGLMNEAARWQAISVYSTMNIPTYTKGYQVAKMVIEKNPQSPEMENWLKMFHRRMEKIDQLGLTEPFVSLLEISTLRSLGTKYFVEHFPSQQPLGFFNKETFVPYFQRRVVDITTSDDIFSQEDMTCAEMAAVLNQQQPKYVSNYENALVDLDKLQEGN